MTATDRLRAMLDERGVEWTKPSGLNSRFADSMTFIGDVAIVSEIDGSDLLRINFDGTPEQAIDATVGRRTCNVEYADDVPDSTKKVLGVYFCSECGSPTYNDVCPTYCMYCGAKVEKVES